MPFIILNLNQIFGAEEAFLGGLARYYDENGTLYSTLYDKSAHNAFIEVETNALTILFIAEIKTHPAVVHTSPTDTQLGNIPVDRRHSACNSTECRTPVEMHSRTVEQWWCSFLC